MEALTPTCGFPQFLEKFLVEYKSHTTDLFHFGFCCCISVNKICCNGNGQFATKFFPTKSWKERNFQRWQKLAKEGRSCHTGGVLRKTLGNMGDGNQWEDFRAALPYLEIRCLPPKDCNNPGKTSKSPTTNTPLEI